MKSEDICTQCGYSHSGENRRRLIRRMTLDGGVAARTIKEAWPCFYPHSVVDDAADKKLFRDMRLIRRAGCVTI